LEKDNAAKTAKQLALHQFAHFETGVTAAFVNHDVLCLKEFVGQMCGGASQSMGGSYV